MNMQINPNDSFPIWSKDDGRTRRVSGATLLSYIEQKNIKSSHINSDGHLIFVLNDNSEIDAGILPPSKMSFSGEGVPQTQVNNLNFSDDFTLTVSNEDGSLSLKANPRTGTVNVDGNITGNIIAGSNISSSYDAETQQTTLNVDESNVDPTKGFTLDKDTAINTQLPDGTPVNAILAPGLVENLLIGNRKQGLNLETKGDGVYIQHDGGSGRIQLANEGIQGLKLTQLVEGKYFNLNDESWATVITDHSSGDISYFVQSGAGELFSGLPSSITLNASTTYIIASEVTSGSGGFAHRLSIVSTAEGEDDANNRTIQRAGSSFDHAKQRWSEVMLKRDAIVFEDMTVGNPQTFDSIIAGANMYGVVNNGALILNSNVSPDVHTFDELTTRVLNIHEGPDNPDKFSQTYVDGNFNTTVHAIGDTHYYTKDKDSGDLTEAYQVDVSGDVGFKKNVTTNDITAKNYKFEASTSKLSSTSDSIVLNADNYNFKNHSSTDLAKINANGLTLNYDLIFDSGETRKIKHTKNIDFEIDGDFVFAAKKTGLKLGKAVDAAGYDHNHSGTIRINDGKLVTGYTVGNLRIKNAGGMYKNDSNDKNSLRFVNDNDIQGRCEHFMFNDNDGNQYAGFSTDGLNMHSRKVINLIDGTEDTDAATVGQLNAVGGGGIPYLRKFDSNGGQIFAHSYPEGRVQAWINYKGNGSTDVSIDSMRPIPEGQTGQMYDMIALDNQSQNVCKLRLFYENSGTTVLRIMPGEVVQCWTSREFKRWKWQYGTESSIAGSTSLAIEENNDEIITPNKGEQFQLIDSSKTASYGNANKQVTYFAPNVGTQSATLLSKLDYGKVFAIHEEINTTKLIMFIHESLVAEIYNRDLTGVNELTMLFTGNSRGRLGKANQTASAQFAINWNGELIPADDDPNALNPEHWVAPDDSVTETWSNSVKSVCYSSGVLANRGSAMLKRGDVIYSKPDSVTHDDSELLETPKHHNVLGDSGETATITYDDDSEFFVMPIVAGGGTFNVMKLFQLFMGRKAQYVDEWGSLKFDQSSDCIGTILKISYDAAIADEEKQEQTQNDELMEGLASGVIYAKTVTVG